MCAWMSRTVDNVSCLAGHLNAGGSLRGTGEGWDQCNAWHCLSQSTHTINGAFQSSIGALRVMLWQGVCNCAMITVLMTVQATQNTIVVHNVAPKGNKALKAP